MVLSKCALQSLTSVMNNPFFQNYWSNVKNTLKFFFSYFKYKFVDICYLIIIQIIPHSVLFIFFLFGLTKKIILWNPFI